jgi:hypothetical protein
MGPINFGSPTFDTDKQVTDLVAAGGGSPNLISASTAIANLAAAFPIVGSWVVLTVNGQAQPAGDLSVLTFLADGTYMLPEDGNADQTGGPGMERGTYSWNPITAAFTRTTTVDTSGDWGLSGATNSSVSLSGDDMTFVDGPDTVVLARVVRKQTDQEIVGSWFIGDPSKPDDLSVITFFADGRYLHGQDGGSADPTGHDGMERGMYTWDPATGALTAAPTRDTNGEWGLSHPAGGALTAKLDSSKNLLTFTDMAGSDTVMRINP